MKKVFIGIDFSKLKFDAVLFEESSIDNPVHMVFENNISGYNSFVIWVKEQTKNSKSSWLICGEHTGLYSFSMTEYLNKAKIDIWLEPGLQIKLSQGISRGKKDKLDAHKIALYAYRFKDKARSTKIRSNALDQLKDLTAYSERLKKIKHILSVSSKEFENIKSNSCIDFICNDSQNKLQEIAKAIKAIEKKIKKLITTHNDLFENYQLLVSIKGIGPKNAVMALILTGNFTLFSDARKFGCYCGVVPFGHSSGTSIRGGDRVCGLANRKMKAFLTQAANSAVIHDKNLNDYYIRKLQDGKEHQLIINNVRNKLIHIMFAVVKNKQAYNPSYANTIINIA